MIEQSLFDAFFKSTPFLASFLGGILTFLSPCIVPLLPAYISYISGLSIQDLKSNQQSHYLKITLSCLSFILGFSLIFILFNFFIQSFLGSMLSHPIVRYIAGGVICLFGLHLTGILRLNLLYKTKRLDFQTHFKGSELLAPFLLGVSFSFGWSPCMGPILAGIFLLSMSEPQNSLSLVVVFCLGLAIPFLLTSLFVGFSLKFVKKMTKYFKIIEILSGLLLIGIGIAIATQKITIFTEFLS